MQDGTAGRAEPVVPRFSGRQRHLPLRPLDRQPHAHLDWKACNTEQKTRIHASKRPSLALQLISRQPPLRGADDVGRQGALERAMLGSGATPDRRLLGH